MSDELILKNIPYLKEKTTRIAPVGGGCINLAYQVCTSSECYFVKLNDERHFGMFEAEADGLAALSKHASEFVVPAVLDMGMMDSRAYLVLEHLALDSQVFDEIRFASALADLHHASSPKFGWATDNFIGTSKQINTPSSNWWQFFAERRLMPQLEKIGCESSAIHNLGLELISYFNKLNQLHSPKPRLIHGDLWSGNWSAVSNGRCCIYDPAVHYADPLCDIAMTKLFGGLSKRFYQHYFSHIAPISEADKLIQLYQLYHVLNHANLFGGGYIAQSEQWLVELNAWLKG